MVNVTYPGVYTQEVASGVHTITGAATSVALFIGKTADGPTDAATEFFKPTDFVRMYSDDPADAYQLPRYVRLFFLNGGTDCWVLRVAAADAKTASSTIETETLSAGATSLVMSALYPGVRGGQLRFAVDYNTPEPDETFNLTVFRLVTDAAGNRTRQNQETWSNLTMDSTSTLAATTVLAPDNSASSLISAAAGTATTGSSSVVTAGRFFDQSKGPAIGQLHALLTAGGSPGRIGVTLSGLPTVAVDLGDASINYGSTEAAWATSVAAAIKNQFQAQSVPNINVVVAFQAVGAITAISFTAPTTPAPGFDISVTALPGGNAGLLMLGAANGGIETSRFGAMRPAPSGISWDIAPQLEALAALDVTGAAFDALTLTLDGKTIALPKPTAGADTNLLFGAAADGASGVGAWLDTVIQAINNTSGLAWRASRTGYRLMALSTLDSDTAAPSGTPSFGGGNAAATALNAATLIVNTPLYVLGTPGGPGVAAATAGSAGGALQQSDYYNAYDLVDRTIPIFNQLSLPPDGWSDDKQTLLGAASAFCLRRHAVLLVDPPTNWTTREKARSGVNTLRIGLANDHAAVYFPRITLNETLNAQVVTRTLGAAGAAAGIMSRIDGNRGVWKASAGLEANVLGVSGVDIDMSDGDTGALNPLGVNAIRKFPDGIVLWGARTLAGDDRFASEYKYLPIRRMSNFLQLSLLNALGWVVFEPNDEPLWAQIRLNVGAFMNTLFRRGAFQGSKPSDAYFVRCDSETTTQDDRNNGIVNIWVGFAPLKPAEFVVVTIQQMAGQIQV
jgi:phage tail sheath protein FI